MNVCIALGHVGVFLHLLGVQGLHRQCRRGRPQQRAAPRRRCRAGEPGDAAAGRLRTATGGHGKAQCCGQRQAQRRAWMIFLFSGDSFSCCVRCGEAALLLGFFLIQPDAKTLPQSGFRSLAPAESSLHAAGRHGAKNFRSLHQITRVWGQSARRCSTAFNPSTPAGRSRHLSAARSARLQKSFPDRGNHPLGK